MSNSLLKYALATISFWAAGYISGMIVGLLAFVSNAFVILMAFFISVFFLIFLYFFVSWASE